MKKKLVSILSAIVMLTVIFLFAGCNIPNNNQNGALQRRETPMTVEEIREMIQKRYFNEDGSVNKDRWQVHGYFPQSELEAFLNQEITGFDVQIIKNAEGKEESFLVEFEPTGHAVGSVWWEQVGDFNIYPSAFKTLKVEEDNRYLFPFLQWWAYATMVDGELIEINKVGLARISEYWNEKYCGGIISVYNFEKQWFDWDYTLRGLWVTDEGYEAPLYNPKEGTYRSDGIGG